MLYCDCCLSIMRQTDAPDGMCPDCGQTMRAPNPDDIVLLAREDFIRSAMLEPLLKDAGIPYQRMGRLGEGFVRSAGALLEQYSFYVPFSDYENARALWVVACGDSGDGINTEEDTTDAF